MCFAWISEQTAIISVYSIKLSVFTRICETDSVYCAVRTGSSNQTYIFVLKGLTYFKIFTPFRLIGSFFFDSLFFPAATWLRVWAVG